MSAKPTPYNAHFTIPTTKPELIIKVRNIKNKNEFFNKLIEDYFSGKLDNSKSKRDSLKDEKLSQEVLKLKIDNKLKLIHDLKLTPDEVVTVMRNPDTFKVDDIDPNQNKKQMSASQWDFVYGCIIDGYKLQGRLRVCTVCQNDFGYSDDDARKHLMQSDDIKHKTAIQNALRGMI